MIKKQIAIVATIATMVFSGCGEDRSHPKGIDANGNPIVHKNPVAVIDLNNTTHQYSSAFNEYRYDTNNPQNPFIFDGKNSYDLDENNQSIVNYDWNITVLYKTQLDVNCTDINITDSRAIVKLCPDARNDANITAKLIVTDDEGATDSASKFIKIN